MPSPHPFGRIRIFPVAIAAAALLLSVKAGAFLDALGAFGGPELTQAQAQTVTPAEPSPAPASGEEAPGAESESETGRDFALVDDMFDPLDLDMTQIALLQDLSARRLELDQRAQELDLQAKLLLATEQKIDAKIAELKRIEDTVGALLKSFDSDQSERIDSLVKIYQSMKPKDAARIFMELDSEVLLDVIERMREAKVAPILALMDPGRAKELTVELAERKRLPETAAKQ